MKNYIRFVKLILPHSGVFTVAVSSMVLSTIFSASPLALIIPLVDNAVIALLGKNRSRYGQQRLWGAIGWGVAGLAAGVLIACGTEEVPPAARCDCRRTGRAMEPYRAARR